MGTGLMRVEAGTHKLSIQLRPAVELPGRREEMRAIWELGARGTFSFASVPTGSLELRVGTWDELEQGRWRARRELLLEPPAAQHVEIELQPGDSRGRIALPDRPA